MIDRCFDLPYAEHVRKMCRHCPRRIALAPPDHRPKGWREEALAELHPLHFCSFALRDEKITPLTLVEKRENERLYAQVKEQFYGVRK